MTPRFFFILGTRNQMVPFNEAGTLEEKQVWSNGLESHGHFRT